MHSNTRFISELLWVMKTHYSRGSSVESHAHQFHYQFMYVVSGHCVYSSRGARFELSAGSCSLLLPGDVHAIEAVDEELTTYELKFLLDAPDFAERFAQAPAVFEADALIHALMPAIAEAASHPASEAHRLAFSYHLGSLLCHIAQPYQAENPEPARAAIAEPSDYLAHFEACSTENFSEATRAAIRYINQNYREEVSLDAICEEIKYNKSYLCYVFKKDTGKTVNDYLTYIRIKTAAQLLTGDRHTPAEICALTGFKTVSHFNRVFKKTIGITPGLYRSAFPKDSIIADLASIEIQESTRAMLSHAVLVELNKKPNGSSFGGEMEGE